MKTHTNLSMQSIPEQEKLYRISERFINGSEGSVFLLGGRWGVGKTYFWKNSVENEIKNQALSYSYTTLFGIETIDQLKRGILSGAIDNDVTNKFTSALSKLTDISSNLESQGNIGSLMKIFTKCSASTTDIMTTACLRKLDVICIDDVERKDEALSLESVFGFMEWLHSINKDLKIVLICNTEELGEDSKVLNRYREKVIDIEYHYKPDPVFNALFILNEHAVPEMANDVISELKQSISQIRINNLRTIHKILVTIRDLLPYLDSVGSELKIQLIRNIVAIHYCHLESKYSPITADLLTAKIDELSKYSRDEDPIEFMSKVHEFRSQLRYTALNIDSQLLDFVRIGYFNEAIFSNQLKEENDRYKRNALDKECNAILEKYLHHTFKPTMYDFKNEFLPFLNENYRQLSLSTFVGVMDCLIAIGLEEEEEEFSQHYYDDVLVKTYPEARKRLDIYDQLNPLFKCSLKQIIFEKDNNSALVALSIKKILLNETKLESSDFSLTDPELIFLNRTQPNDFSELFKNETNSKLIRTLLNYCRLYAKQPFVNTIKHALESMKGLIDENDSLAHFRLKRCINAIKTPE